MLRRLIEKHRLDGIEMVFTVPIGARRRRQLDAFYADNRDRLGAAVGGSDCHFGAHDIGVVVTRYEGDFRRAVEDRSTKPMRRPGSTVRSAPSSSVRPPRRMTRPVTVSRLMGADLRLLAAGW